MLIISIYARILPSITVENGPSWMYKDVRCTTLHDALYLTWPPSIVYYIEMCCHVNSSTDEELYLVPDKDNWYIVPRHAFTLKRSGPAHSYLLVEVLDRNLALAWSHDVNKNALCVMPRYHSSAALYVMLSSGVCQQGVVFQGCSLLPLSCFFGDAGMAPVAVGRVHGRPAAWACSSMGICFAAWPFAEFGGLHSQHGLSPLRRRGMGICLACVDGIVGVLP